MAIDGLDQPFVRLAKVDTIDHLDRRGDRKNGLAAAKLAGRLSEIKALDGPATVHAVDELAAALFEHAANFGPAIEGIRRSAQAHIRRGTRWLQFRPIVIQSAPGADKTRFVNKLAELSRLPLAYLDCAAMGNLGPIISQDASWSTSRHSDVMQALAYSASANLIVCLFELDKLKDYGRGSSPEPSEALVGLLEKRSAATHTDNFLQLQVDLSFINWVILVNDLERLSKPLLERCTLVRVPPPTADEIGRIASREIVRRGLEPGLVVPIAAAVRAGKITSLRKLHKLLDAAAAASSRQRFN